MTQQFDNMLINWRSDSRIHDIAEGSETDDDLVYVSIGKIFEDGGNKHDEQIWIFIEEERAHEVADSFEY